MQIWQSDLPKQRNARFREFRALSTLLQVPVRQIIASLRRHRDDPLTPVKIKEEWPSSRRST